MSQQISTPVIMSSNVYNTSQLQHCTIATVCAKTFEGETFAVFAVLHPTATVLR